MQTENEKLKEFLGDIENWRLPSYTQIMRHMGWKSKNSAAKALKKLKENGYEPRQKAVRMVR